MPNEIHAMGGQPLKFVVRCEVCGHQAFVGAVVKHGQLPRFYCSICGERDPLVEQSKGGFRKASRRVR